MWVTVEGTVWEPVVPDEGSVCLETDPLGNGSCGDWTGWVDRGLCLYWLILQQVPTAFRHPKEALAAIGRDLFMVLCLCSQD